MPKIILSYRRSDSETIAGRIRDKLASHYGGDSVFMDIDSIPFGLDFREHVQNALLQNDILLAVIGPRWAGSGSGSQTRINEETDPVRIEVETALKRGIPVVPILVGGTSMPAPAELPEGLKDLPFRNAAQVDGGRDFHFHMERLIRSMDRILEVEAGVSSSSSRDLATPGPSAPGKPSAPGTADAIFKYHRGPTPIPINDGGAALQTSRLGHALAKPLIKLGLQFEDQSVEREFLNYYRRRFYSFGQSLMGLAIAAWMLLGSAAFLTAEIGEPSTARFHYMVGAPLLMVLFAASFTEPAKRWWQQTFLIFAVVGSCLTYGSLYAMRTEKWFRPEYPAMCFMLLIALVGSSPLRLSHILGIGMMVIAMHLYYSLVAVPVPAFVGLHAFFSVIYLGAALIAVFCGAVFRERALRREFLAERAATPPSGPPGRA